MMFCACANPACMVNGCQIAKGYRQEYAPNADPHRIGQATPLPPAQLTPEDIRRIVREELERQKKSTSMKDSTGGSGGTKE